MPTSFETNHRDCPHSDQIARSELFDGYCNGGLPKTEAIERTASELNVTKRTIFRARNHSSAFQKLPEWLRDISPQLVDAKKVAVDYVYELATMDEGQQRDVLNQWEKGAYPRPETIVVRDGEELSVTVPVDDGVEEEIQPVRQSCHIQGLLARCGQEMGFKVWIPKNDRMAVLKEWTPNSQTLIEKLPLSYDEATIQTIEQIDVIWLKGRAIVRAFEVEHTTAVYSGILRMADLLALQPNMNIKLHIVAPDVRREKVFREIRRPVFSLLDRGPLAETCSFLSYDAVEAIIASENLDCSSDKLIDKHASFAAVGE